MSKKKKLYMLSNLEKKLCLNCGNGLNVSRKKFCSQKCGCTYHNHKNRILKNCLICGTRLDSNKKNWCSKLCRAKAIKLRIKNGLNYQKPDRGQETYGQKSCNFCGTMFYNLKENNGVFKRRLYCSANCRKKVAGRIYLSKRGNKDRLNLRLRTKRAINQLFNGVPKGVRGEKNNFWKCGRYKHRGYIYVKNYEHPFKNKDFYVTEHRLVMESWLKENHPESEFLIEVDGIKYLRPGVVVHHIDNNPSNNLIENLFTFKNQSKHVSYHMKPNNWFNGICEDIIKKIIGVNVYVEE